MPRASLNVAAELLCTSDRTGLGLGALTDAVEATKNFKSI